MPIAGLSLLPVFIPGWPLLLLPIHIVFLELVIDPSCTLVFEGEEAESDVMQRPPRNPEERLFSLHSMGLAILQGLSVLVACVGIYVFARQTHPEYVARALTFATLVVAFLAIILTNRSWTMTTLGSLRSPNAALKWVLGGTIGFLALVMLLPFAQGMFHFAPVPFMDLGLSIVAGVVCVVWFDALKLYRRWAKQQSPAA